MTQHQYQEYGLKGRVAIVTGAGSGVGEACAIELAKGGARVALLGRRIALVEKVRMECMKYTDKAIALSVDVGDENAVRTGVGKVLETFGKVDILINCAGFENRLKPGETFWDDHFDNLTPEEYMKFFRTHALGHYLMNLAVIPSMQKHHFGRVVNIASVLGVTAIYEGPAYSASKAAAINQTKSFAKKYGKDNITFNSIAPGMIDTPMKIDATPEETAAVIAMTPMGRIAQAIDVARVALFFAQENLFVSGQNIIVDGASTV
jgi:NAD(P)-dependent dehydrogenase (short-subunit alcohol dehydrogenase family)